MASETTDSSVGPPSSDAPNPKNPGATGSSSADFDEVAPPVLPPYSSTSGDELNVLLSQSLTHLKPDPFLGEFSAESSKAETVVEDPPHESFDAVTGPEGNVSPQAGEAGGGQGAPGQAPAPRAPNAAPHGDAGPSSVEDWPASSGPGLAGLGSSEISVNVPNTSSFDMIPAAEPSGPPPQPASFDAFPSLDLSAPPAATAASKSAKKQEPDDDDDDEEEDEDEPSRGSSLMTFLLFSYASAVTLGLAWVLITGRRLNDRDDEFVPVADAKADPGHRADQSRKVAPPPPIAKDHVTGLGKTLQLGGLEVTPLEVVSKPVRLKRALSLKDEFREGGSKALWLKLKLKNVTKDTIFAPFDEAFVRERAVDVLDSLIESGDGAQIVMYPLAVTSEWVVDGQEFKELRPGESFDTWAVSASEAVDRLPGEMTWRVRLRTGMDQTETVGVRFRASDLRSRQ